MEITKKEIALQYLALLPTENINKLISLFSKTGLVISPIYGELKADEFYNALNEDTTSSELKLKGIFEELGSNRLAIYFEYKWTLKSDKIVKFDVVDIIEFDTHSKIEKLTIIYDTAISRKLIEEINKQVI